MIADAPQYIVLILLESFHIKVFNCKLISIRNKYLYIFDTLFCTTALNMSVRNNAVRKQFIASTIQSLVREGILKEGSKVYFITQLKDIDQTFFSTNVELYPLLSKDLALVPYFTSAFLDAYHMAFCYLSYFSSSYIDNKGFENSMKWNGWESLAERIIANSVNNSPEFINNWLNVLIHPSIEDNSFYVASIASLLLNDLNIIIENEQKEKLNLLLGGEVYSWLATPDDLLFSILTGFTIRKSHISVYHDTVNVFTLTKALKASSLNLLEQVTGKFTKHIGEIITIKTSKSTKTSVTIGKITIHDDEGFRTLFPLTEDIIKVHLHGLAKITCNLTSPFYLDDNICEFIVRDLLIIDTRTVEKNNLMNFKAWYDRIVSQ